MAFRYCPDVESSTPCNPSPSANTVMIHERTKLRTCILNCLCCILPLSRLIFYTPHNQSARTVAFAEQNMMASMDSNLCCSLCMKNRGDAKNRRVQLADGQASQKALGQPSSTQPRHHIIRLPSQTSPPQINQVDHLINLYRVHTVGFSILSLTRHTASNHLFMRWRSSALLQASLPSGRLSQPCPRS